jgi:hypothetical protein
MAAKKTPKKSRSGPSGPSLTDEQREELGQGRMTLRMPLDGFKTLKAAAKREGKAPGVLVYELVKAHLKG